MYYTRKVLHNYTTKTLSNKARIKQLAENLARMEAAAFRSSPITVLHVRECAHPECGKRTPKELPADALVIHLGCLHHIPTRPDANTDPTPANDGSSALDPEQTRRA